MSGSNHDPSQLSNTFSTMSLSAGGNRDFETASDHLEGFPASDSRLNGHGVDPSDQQKIASFWRAHGFTMKDIQTKLSTKNPGPEHIRETSQLVDQFCENLASFLEHESAAFRSLLSFDVLPLLNAQRYLKQACEDSAKQPNDASRRHRG
ncbi:uncharacterized protein L203_101226 [Cryptococcus depauperatus CBS 7841]|uniref:Uncharacterized protein n=1 Tax=Cryptococcus depauperatus CBS 7841 TaxID=1295531 RepID=A0AAJ8LZF9_9TREE